jgi:hypothetical protein
LPKLLYILRCSPCFNSAVITRYDDCIRDTLEIILNFELSDHSWLQASLPVSADGLGVRTASQLVLPAFLSSVVRSVGLCQQILPSRLHSSAGLQDVHFTAACDLWKARTPAAPPFDASSKSWESPLVAAALSLLLITAPDQTAVARLTAVSAPHAGCMLLLSLLVERDSTIGPFELSSLCVLERLSVRGIAAFAGSGRHQRHTRSQLSQVSWSNGPS